MLKYNAIHQLDTVGVQQKMEIKYLVQANEENATVMKVSIKESCPLLRVIDQIVNPRQTLLPKAGS